jgi:hypothetical protein
LTAQTNESDTADLVARVADVLPMLDGLVESVVPVVGSESAKCSEKGAGKGRETDL